MPHVIIFLWDQGYISVETEVRKKRREINIISMYVCITYGLPRTILVYILPFQFHRLMLFLNNSISVKQLKTKRVFHDTTLYLYNGMGLYSNDMQVYEGFVQLTQPTMTESETEADAVEQFFKSKGVTDHVDCLKGDIDV